MAVAIYGVLLSVSGAQENLAGDVRTLGIIALAGVVLTALVGLLVVRSVVDPVDDITAATRDLADNRLPQLVEALRNPGASTPEFPPIEFDQSDELGRLAEALNDVQDSATQVAIEQQSLVRQGLSELVVNMARRNQTLLDRQIEYIDRLEEQLPEVLAVEELFGLDHLATRMRRNAESLLVLAGSEPPRRRGGPIAMNELVRVAMSEIEDYRNVTIDRVDDAEIGPQAAFDLAHLLSELLENATQFSPPETQVEIGGRAQDDGAYLLSISDHGIGMSAEQLTTYNQLLTNPPELDINLSRSLGFMVIGRLAKRNKLRVELAAKAGGGVTALVLVPQSVLSGAVTPTPTEAETETPAPAISAEAPTPTFEQPPSPVDAGRPMPPPPPPNVPVTPRAEHAPAPPSSPASPLQPAPPPAAPSDVPAIAVPFDLPEESGWTPANIPDRGAAELGRRSGGGAATPPEPARPVAAPTADPARSEALSKLLGAAPKGLDNPAPSSTQPEVSTPTSSMPLPTRGLDDGRTAMPPQAEAPTAPQAEPPAVVPTGREAPDKLEEAIPSGERFDAGVNSLLGGAPDIPSAPILPPRGAGGLVKRDRRKSQAPDGEGRTIPTEPAGTAAKASSRKPEEVREMLARYRTGRNQPSDQSNGEATTPTTNTDSGGPA